MMRLSLQSLLARRRMLLARAFRLDEQGRADLGERAWLAAERADRVVCRRMHELGRMRDVALCSASVVVLKEAS